ncbi:MAG: hypothetical protein AAF514_16405 [Verrucomicrobiota bacterium]
MSPPLVSDLPAIPIQTASKRALVVETGSFIPDMKSVVASKGKFAGFEKQHLGENFGGSFLSADWILD